MKLHSLTVDVKTILVAEAATIGVLCKKVFWEISQNSQENTYVRVSFLIKLPAFSKKIFFTEHLWTTASSSFHKSKSETKKCAKS